MGIKDLDHQSTLIYLSETDYGRLATCLEDKPYITPLNYIFHEDAVYFHTGFKGHKMDILDKNANVCFEISGMGQVYQHKKACKHTTEFWSVLIFGKVEQIVDASQKLQILNKIMEKYSPDKGYDPLEPSDTKGVNIIKINIESITGKQLIRP